MAPLQDKNLDAFSYCAVSATEYCTLMYWVSAGVFLALAVSVFAFSVLCCISRRRRTPSRRSKTLPYYSEWFCGGWFGKGQACNSGVEERGARDFAGCTCNMKWAEQFVKTKHRDSNQTT